jgi:hypothetical protein
MDFCSPEGHDSARFWLELDIFIYISPVGFIFAVA